MRCVWCSFGLGRLYGAVGPQFEMREQSLVNDRKQENYVLQTDETVQGISIK